MLLRKFPLRITNMKYKLTYELDEHDYKAIITAIGLRQTCVFVGSNIRAFDPAATDDDGDLSDRAGRILADVCRDWVVVMGRGDENGWGNELLYELPPKRERT